MSEIGMFAFMALGLGSLLFVIGSMIRTIRNERARGRPVWREFGLGLALMILFFATWIAHGFAEWQTYTDEQRAHGEPTTAGDFASQFAQSTLENWQSEFLQLFAFVSLAGLYMFKGSAESKDSEEKIEASLRRIEEQLGTLPDDAPSDDDAWKLPDAPPLAQPSPAPTRAELYEQASALDVEGRSTMTKDQLADAVEDAKR